MSVGPVLTYNMVYTTSAPIDIEWVNNIQNSFSDAICSVHVYAVRIMYTPPDVCTVVGSYITHLQMV